MNILNCVEKIVSNQFATVSNFHVECLGHVDGEPALRKALCEALRQHYYTHGMGRLKHICYMCQCACDETDAERTIQNILDSGNLEFQVVV
jgi:hypothetical protein